eukprot:1802912-Rhodomonas_salina.1
MVPFLRLCSQTRRGGERSTRRIQAGPGPPGGIPRVAWLQRSERFRIGHKSASCRETLGVSLE